MSDIVSSAEIVRPPFMLAAERVIELHQSLGTGNTDDEESLWAEVGQHDDLSRQSGPLSNAAQQFDFVTDLHLDPDLIHKTATDLREAINGTTFEGLGDIYRGFYADRLNSILGIEVDGSETN